MVEPSGVKLGSLPLSEVIWLKPPPVIGRVAMPAAFGKTMVWPLAETSGRSLALGVPQAAEGQSWLTTPVLGLTRLMLLLVSM